MSDEADDLSNIPPSMLERVGAQFGIGGLAKQDVPRGTPTQEPVDELAELEWDGRTYNVPKNLKDAFMRNDDYTKKTQQLSETRAGYEQMRALSEQRVLESNFSQSIQGEAQEISVIDAYLQQAAKMDWSAMNTEQIMRNKIELDTIKERKAALKASIDEKRTKFQDEMKTKLGELRGKSRQIAATAISGFSEDTEKAMKAYALGEGLTESEFDSISLDPRSFKIVYKAMQFDKVQANVGKATDTASKVIKPGAASERMPPDVRNRLEYGKALKGARTSAQKATVIEGRLEGMFGRR